MALIDLHIHTTASDGTDAPAVVVEKARDLGLAAIAITDHDTVAGIAPAMEAGARLGVEVVPGIEVSSDYRGNNVHVLGYYIDPDSPGLRPVLEWVAAERKIRNEKMVALLAADGFDISMADLEAAYPHSVLGRPHVAEWLMRKGYVSSVREGFSRYLREGKKYYLPKRRIPLSRAIEVIGQAGGLSVLAHPLQYQYTPKEVMELLYTANALGIRGLECWYSEFSPQKQAWLARQADRFGLCATGGSDYHGTRKPQLSIGSGTGDLAVPYEVLEKLKERKYG